MLHLDVCRSRSLFRISDFISVLVQTVLVLVQLFKWTDGKPGGSPLLLPYVQISHRFWRSVLPVDTGHPVSIFPHLGFTACNFVIFASLISCSCFNSLLSSWLQVSVLPQQEGRCGWHWSPSHQETSCTAAGGSRPTQLGPRLSPGDWLRGERQPLVTNNRAADVSG